MIEDRSRPGTCDVIAQIRVKGDQHVQVRVMDPVSGVHTSEIAIGFGKALIYIEDRRALQELTRALRWPGNWSRGCSAAASPQVAPGSRPGLSMHRPGRFIHTSGPILSRDRLVRDPPAMRNPVDDFADIDPEDMAAVPVEHITVQLPPGASEADYRAAYAAIAEQDGHRLLFPERLTAPDPRFPG